MWPCSSERSAACSLGAVAGADAAVIAGEAWWADTAGAANATPVPRTNAQATVSDFMTCLLVVYRGVRSTDHGAFAHIVNLYMCKASVHRDALWKAGQMSVLVTEDPASGIRDELRGAALRNDRQTTVSGN